MPKPKLGFPRSSRILRSADFRIVYDNGIRVSSPVFAAFCKARDAGSEHAGSEHAGAEDATSRLGLTVPRALGKAVVRNRLKRRFREAFRLHRSELAKPWDIVINPRRAAIDAPFAEIERAIQKVIEKCERA